MTSGWRSLEETNGRRHLPKLLVVENSLMGRSWRFKTWKRGTYKGDSKSGYGRKMVGITWEGRRYARLGGGHRSTGGFREDQRWRVKNDASPLVRCRWDVFIREWAGLWPVRWTAYKPIQCSVTQGRRSGHRHYGEKTYTYILTTNSSAWFRDILFEERVSTWSVQKGNQLGSVGRQILKLDPR